MYRLCMAFHSLTYLPKSALPTVDHSASAWARVVPVVRSESETGEAQLMSEAPASKQMCAAAESETAVHPGPATAQRKKVGL